MFADGLRNTVGLAFDGNGEPARSQPVGTPVAAPHPSRNTLRRINARPQAWWQAPEVACADSAASGRAGELWGVENGADKLKRSDLGGDIHNENPAEELNRFGPAGANLTAVGAAAPGSSGGTRHWGYPWCWSEYALPAGVGRGRGAVWAWPGAGVESGPFFEEGAGLEGGDTRCRERTEPCAVAMQARGAARAPLALSPPPTLEHLLTQRPSPCSLGALRSSRHCVSSQPKRQCQHLVAFSPRRRQRLLRRVWRGGRGVPCRAGGPRLRRVPRLVESGRAHWP